MRSLCFLVLFILFFGTAKAGCSVSDLRSERWILEDGNRVRRLVKRRILVRSNAKPYVCRIKARWPDGRLRLIQACTVRRGGRRIKVPLKDVHFRRDGLTEMFFSFPRATEASVLEYEAEESLPSESAGPFRFTPSHLFTSSRPIDEDVFEILLPGSLELTYVAHRMGQSANPVVSWIGRKRLWRWTMRDIRPAQREPLEPPPLKKYPLIRATVLRDWKPVASWLSTLLERNVRPDADIAGTALMMVGDVTDDWNRIRLIQQEVSRRLRHVELDTDTAEELAGHSPEVVLKRGYGDCVDRAVLCSALLAALGIKASPVYLCTNRYRSFDPEIPTIFCGDHCIVKVDCNLGTMFVDPGAPYYRFSTLPAEDQGRCVFDPMTCSFYRTPLSTAGENGIDIRQELELTGDGLLGDFTIQAYGEDEALLRRRVASASGRSCLKSVVKKYLKSSRNSVITELDLSLEPMDLSGPFILSGKYLDTGAVRNVGPYTLLSLPVYSHRTDEVTADERLTPLVYRNCAGFRAVSHLKLPATARVLYCPSGFRMRIGPVSDRIEYRLSKGFLTVDERYERTVAEIEAGLYKDYKGLLRARAAAGKRVIVLEKACDALRSSCRSEGSGGGGGAGNSGESTCTGDPGQAVESAPAFIESSELVLRLRQDRTAGLERRDVIVIRNSAGLSSADVVLGVPRDARLLDLEGITRSPGLAETIPLDKSTLRTNCLRKSKVLRFSFSRATPGSRLLWRCKLSLPAADWGRLWSSGRLPVKSLKIQLIAPGGLELKTECLGAAAERKKTRHYRKNRKQYILMEFDNITERDDLLVRYSLCSSWKELIDRLPGGKFRLPGRLVSVRRPAVERIYSEFLKCGLSRGRNRDALYMGRLLFNTFSRSGLKPELWLSRSCDLAGGLPCLDGFDRALVNVGGKWFSHDGSFGADGKTEMLRIAGGRLERKISSRPGGNGSIEESVQAVLDNCRNLTVEFVRSMAPDLCGELKFRLNRLSERARRQLLLREIYAMYPKARVQYMEFDGLDSAGLRLKMRFALKLPDYGWPLATGGILMNMPENPSDIGLGRATRHCSYRLKVSRGKRIWFPDKEKKLDSQACAEFSLTREKKVGGEEKALFVVVANDEKH